MRTAWWKPAIGAGCLLLAMGLHFASVPTADAAKVRKKPPRQRLSTPVVVVDAGPDTSSEVAQPVPAEQDAGSTPKSICLYGEERDPDTQALRCLSQEDVENRRRGASVDSEDPSEDAPDAGREGEPDAGVEEEEGSKRARVVRVSFENGVVGGALRNLRERSYDMEACIDKNGGLRVKSARLKLMFFVRPDQKASGMIVASARNVPAPIVRCVRRVIEEGVVGRPSSEAVGVTVLVELKNVDT